MEGRAAMLHQILYLQAGRRYEQKQIGGIKTRGLNKPIIR